MLVPITRLLRSVILIILLFLLNNTLYAQIKPHTGRAKTFAVLSGGDLIASDTLKVKGKVGYKLNKLET